MVEDRGGNPPTIQDALDWKTSLELTMEVLADSDEAWVEGWGDEDGGIFVQHSYTVIASDGTVTWHSKGQDGDTLDEVITAVQEAD